MYHNLTKAQKRIAASTWNKEPGNMAAVAQAAGCTVREARQYLSSRKGYPHKITDAKPATRLTMPQSAVPAAPVTLPSLAFLNPDRRYPWESRR